MTYHEAVAAINARYKSGERDIEVSPDVYTGYVEGLKPIIRDHQWVMFKDAKVRKAASVATEAPKETNSHESRSPDGDGQAMRDAPVIATRQGELAAGSEPADSQPIIAASAAPPPQTETIPIVFDELVPNGPTRLRLIDAITEARIQNSVAGNTWLQGVMTRYAVARLRGVTDPDIISALMDIPVLVSFIVAFNIERGEAPKMKEQGTEPITFKGIELKRDQT